MHRQRVQELCLPECIARQDAATLPAHNFYFTETPSMIIEDGVHRIERYVALGLAILQTHAP